MIGLDTNIIVRYITQDDPAQSTKANELFERQLTQKNPGFVSVVAMVETVWVLDRAYGFTGDEIAAAVEGMLQTNVLVVENEEQVFAAVSVVRNGDGSFSDALMGALGAKAGCSRTLTFDQKAACLPTFSLA